MFRFSFYITKHLPFFSNQSLISPLRFCTFYIASSFPFLKVLSHSLRYRSPPPLALSFCSYYTRSFSSIDPIRLSSLSCSYHCLISIISNGPFRFFCASCELEREKQKLSFAELVARNEPTLEATLCALNIAFAVGDVADIFKLLNSRNAPGLRFFAWIRLNQPALSRNPIVCSFVVNNCGHLKDYTSMVSILKEFRMENICLTKNAFFFLICCPTEDYLSLSTQRVVDVLREAGGSCYSTGIHALVDAFSSKAFFSMAKTVIEQCGKPSHYSVVIKELCGRNQVYEAKKLLNDLKQQGQTPHPLSLNYIISHQCKDNASEAWKSFEEMKDFNCEPDALTYEVLVAHLCRSGKLEDALKLVGEMKVEPRISTHVLVIKEIFKAGKHEEAHEYVLNVVDKQCANALYSLLVKLHKQRGDLAKAKDILFEMMKNDLIPESNVFFKILKGLKSSGEFHLASLLKKRFFMLVK